MSLLAQLTVAERKELIKGLEEHNNGKYFACHETLEDIWMDKTDDLRRILQGLIHVAVGFYHLRDSNYRGASSQLKKACTKLEDFEFQKTGINIQWLLGEVELWLERIKVMESHPDMDIDFGDFPKIHYDGETILTLSAQTRSKTVIYSA